MPYIGRSLGDGVRARYIYAATSGQTTFSGNDSNGIALAYSDTLYMDVYQNGVLLKPVTDYASTTGTSVVLVTGASTDDVVEMIVYDSFAVADTVSAANGGTFSGNMAMGGTLGVTGITTATGGLNVGTIKDAGANTTAMTISSDGEVTKPAQPAFSASPSTTQSNLAINGYVDVVLGTEVYDVGSNFASNTFTAPVTGKYQLSFQIYALAIDENSAYVQMLLDTSNRDYFQLFDPGVFDQEGETFTFILSVLADMDANDTAKVSFYQQGGTAQVDISTASFFTGVLVC